MAEIISCPFCGGDEIEALIGAMKCAGCGAIGPCDVRDPVRALAAWNRRAPSDTLAVEPVAMSWEARPDRADYAAHPAPVKADTAGEGWEDRMRQLAGCYGADDLDWWVKIVRQALAVPATPEGDEQPHER